MHVSIRIFGDASFLASARLDRLELALLLLLVFGVGCGWMVPPFLYVAWIDRLL